VNKHRLQFGSTIVEVRAHPEDSFVTLTVSKHSYEDDAVHVSLPRGGARALAALLAEAGE